MANFKSNASRKRFLALRNKRKYAVGGLTSSTNMYGDNTIPYTASTVYEESNPEYQQELANQLTAVKEDTSYQENAISEINRQNKIEGRVKQVGSMGLNKLADMAPDDFVGPDMGEDPQSLLKTGFDAAKRQRQLNIIAQGGDKAAKTLQKAKTTGDLLEGLATHGTQATSSAVKAGTSAVKSGLGVGTVGALMAAGGDKLYDKVDDNDATTLTNKEAGASALRGAGAGIGALSTASAIGATVLPGMFAAGAANAWNPIGWATLAAAGIGAGVTAINRKRKANKAGDAMDAAEDERDADVARINRMQRMDALKDKQYSGFDYGGDTKGPGFYGKGGIKKYQTEGVSESNLPQTDLYQSVQPWTKGKLFKGDNNWAKAANWLSGDQITRELVDSLASTRDASDEYTGVNQDFSTWQSEQEANDAWSPMTEEGDVNPNFNPQLAGGTDPYDVYQEQAESTMPWNAGIGYGGGNFNIGLTSPYKMKLPFVDHEIRLGASVGTDMFKPGAWSAEGDYGAKLPWNWFGKTGGLRYRSGGIKKYQETGVVPQYDVLADNRPDKGFWDYNPSYRNDEIRARNKINSRPPAGARYIKPENTFVSGMDPDDPNFLSVMQSQGGFPIGEAEIVGDFVPQDIPKGADPYANNSMEQKIFDNLGMDGVLRYRQGKSNQHAATDQAGKMLLTAGALAAAPAVIPEVIAAGSSIAGSNAATLTSNLARFGATETAVGRTLLKPFQYYGGNTVNAFNSLRQGGGAWNTVKNAANLGYNALSTRGVAEGYRSGINQIGTELSGEGNYQNRLGTASDAMALFGGGKGQFANWLTGNKFGVSPKEVTKISSDIADKDYLSAFGRTVLSPFADSSQSSWGGMFNTTGKFINKAMPNIKADDSLPEDVAGAGTNLANEAMGFVTDVGNVPSVYERANQVLPGRGYKVGGVKDLPGGKVVDIGNGAKKYIGQTHAQGGIMADPQSEIENNEVERDVTLADGTKNPYIYSEYLNMDGSKGYKTGGVSIADKAEELARTGAPQPAFDALAAMQEKAAGRTGNKIMGTTMAKYGGFQNTPTNYKKGGVTSYQTRGLVMSQERQEQFDNLIQWIPNVGYVGPDGTNYGFNEADVVDFVNRGGLDSYNPNQGDTYMPSEESMLRDRQQAFRDALRGNRQPAPTNEAVADPNFRVGQQGDLVVNPNTVPEMQTLDERIAAMNQWQIDNPPAPPPAQNEVADAAELARVEEARVQAEEANQNASSPTVRATTSPFDTVEEERAFQDWATAQGHDTKGYGWGSASQGIYDKYGEDFFVARANAGGDPLRVTTSSVMSQPTVGDTPPRIDAVADYNNDGSIDYDGNPLTGNDIDLTGENVEVGKSNDPTKGKGKDKGSRRYDDKSRSGTLLKAAQFIPAAMAYMDKPDYMKQPNKVGGVPRVNLENVSLDDRQAVINSDNAAVQRMISNSGMGSAGFAARMAAWQKKEGLSAAVTAEQRRMNSDINNREAQMNVQVEAQNRAIQAQNRQAEMEVNRFNTESKAATKAQRVDAVANATTGLLTGWMDQKKMDTSDRLGRAIEGQTKVLDNERFRDQTRRYIKDNDLDITDFNSPEYYEIYDMFAGTTKEKSKFGGMRKIPSYGYSTK
jgi:hypothetical protein